MGYIGAIVFGKQSALHSLATAVYILLPCKIHPLSLSLILIRHQHPKHLSSRLGQDVGETPHCVFLGTAS